MKLNKSAKYSSNMSYNSTNVYGIIYRKILQCIFEKDIFYVYLNQSDKSTTSKFMQLEIALMQN